MDPGRDRALDAKEKQALREMTENSLREFHYFTAAGFNCAEHPNQTIEDFSARPIEGHQDSLNFLVPCRVAAIAGTPKQTHTKEF